MALGALFVFCLGVAAQAAPPLKAPPQQEPPPPRPTQADDVTIRGSGGPAGSATVPPLEEAARRLGRTPGGVDLIDTDEIRTGAALLPTDVFRFSAGVYMQSRFGSDESRLSIRGSGLQRTFHGRGIWVLQDGVPINLADGSFDMQAIEPLAARYVEVWRGGNALSYGASTLGGAINYVSPTGYDADVALGRFEGGSFGYLRGQMSTGQAVDGSDFYASVTALESDGYRDHADQSHQRLFSNLGHRITPTIETRVYLTHARTDSELPGSLTKGQMRDDPRQAAPSHVAGDQKRDFWLTRVADKTTFSLGTEARFEATLAWSRKHLFHPIFQVIDQESDDVTGAFVYASEARLFGSKNLFRMGFLPGYGLNADDRHANVGGHSGARLAENDLTATSLVFFLEEQHYVSERL
ncbi:MAG TPA: TonB-dependent receptor plug domain-containing protein, partial [Planctomycetota bacterium]|nr:TonB-dependent receptor plug domain-containing protein [Planctomycetota bacterium]